MSDIPNFHIKAIDTTGAGDAFDAGFIYALHKKQNLIECGYYGVAAASIKVQHVGARSSDINPESIEKMKSANVS
jgi:sugar/nucleoside kinase (ribokinase family)